jgi:hypothetical protein
VWWGIALSWACVGLVFMVIPIFGLLMLALAAIAAGCAMGLRRWRRSRLLPLVASAVAGILGLCFLMICLSEQDRKSSPVTEQDWILLAVLVVPYALAVALSVASSAARSVTPLPPVAARAGTNHQTLDTAARVRAGTTGPQPAFEETRRDPANDNSERS